MNCEVTDPLRFGQKKHGRFGQKHGRFGKTNIDVSAKKIDVSAKIYLIVFLSSFLVQGSVFRRIDALLGEFKVGGGVHDKLHIPVRTGGVFYLSWHRHQIEGPSAFSVSSERQR